MAEREQLYPDYLFEVSWEVCNLVGGIYTVLSTKARTLQKINKDKNIFIGPDVWKNAPSPYFIESHTLLKAWKAKALKEGLKVRVGRWNIPGKPVVILVDYQDLFSQRNDIYTEMWNEFGVKSLHAYGDYDDCCMFACAAAQVIEHYYRHIGGEKYRVVAHFDEWQTGMGLLYVRKALPAVATVFTTHATSIGRSIAGNNKPLYGYLYGYNGTQMSEELNMEAKHSVERQAAHFAHAFTTVSDVTAVECRQLLEKEPDVVTPNGFEADFVPKGESYATKRAAARRRLLQIASALIGYKAPDDALLVATSGRYEYKNKGIDLYVDALNRLRQRYDGEREIIAFVMVPAWVKEPRADLAARLAEGGDFHTPLPDPCVTHTLHNGNDDKVMSQIRYCGFSQTPESKLKIIFIPSYLTGNDGIVDLTYYDTLVGLDATAFPSYYEPWGYTPLESVAFGVPTVTTDLSGFGMWIKNMPGYGLESKGVAVLHRTDFNFVEVSDNLSETLEWLATVDAPTGELVAQSARNTAAEAQWSHFISYYRKAYDLALRRVAEEQATATGETPLTDELDEDDK